METTKQQAWEKPLFALWRTKACGLWGFPVPWTQYFFPGKNRLVLFSTLLCRDMLQKWTIPIWYIWFHLHFRTRRKFFLGTSQKSTISTTGTWELVLHPRVLPSRPVLFCWVLCHAHTHTVRKSHPHSASVCPIKHICREHLQDPLFHLFLWRLYPLCIYWWFPLAGSILTVLCGQYFTTSLGTLVDVTWLNPDGFCLAPLWGSFLSVQLICPVFLLLDQKTLYIW